MTTVETTTPRAHGCLSVGKRRGLQTLSTKERVFAVLAVDHISALSLAARPEDPSSLTSAELVSLKLRLVEEIATPASGILIDAALGLEPLVEQNVLPGATGLMVGLEDTDYASVGSSPRLFEGWDVARAAASGATAVKCSFVYDPFAPTNDTHEFVSDLVAACETFGLPLFAEPLTPQSQLSNRRSVVIETAKRIGALNVDILKLEAPLDDHADEAELVEACHELTQATPVPWTLLSGGADFDTFAHRLEIACKAGASGYVAGRTVWKDFVIRIHSNAPSATLDANRRLRHLTDIAVAFGRPWSDCYGQSDSECTCAAHGRHRATE